MGRITRQKDLHSALAQGDHITVADGSTKLDAILATLVKLDAKVDTVASDLNLLRADQRKIRERMKGVETEVAALIPQAKDMQSQVLELHKRVGYLEFRAEDAEGRARRNNICIIGLPAGVGKDSMVD